MAKKTVVIEIAEAINRNDKSLALNLVSALDDSFKGNAYGLSNAGVLYEGKSGETLVEFHNQELFIRFNRAHRDAQKEFVEGVYRWIDREKTDILIEVDWSDAGKRRTIKASLIAAKSPRLLVFDLLQ